MRRTGDTWEYIATYVDDLAMALKNPTEVTNALCNKYGYKLKGVGPIDYHLGSDYKRDPDGTLYVSAESYIEKMNKISEPPGTPIAYWNGRSKLANLRLPIVLMC